MHLGDPYSDYAGAVRCMICRSILEIKMKDGKLRSMKPLVVAEKPRKEEEVNT